MSHEWVTVPLGELLTRSEEWININPEDTYRQVTVRMRGQGVVQRDVVTGAEIAAPSRLVVRPRQFIISRLDARNGASGLIPDSLDGAVVSTDFPVFNVNQARLAPEWLGWLSKTPGFVDLCRAASEGTTNRVRLKEDRFLATRILLPSLGEQRRIVARVEALAAKIEEGRGLRRWGVDMADNLVSAESGRVIDGANRTFGVRTFGSFQPHVTSGPRYWSALCRDGGRFRFYRAQDIGRDGDVMVSPALFLDPPESQQGQSALLTPGDLLSPAQTAKPGFERRPGRRGPRFSNLSRSQ